MAKLDTMEFDSTTVISLLKKPLNHSLDVRCITEVVISPSARTAILAYYRSGIEAAKKAAEAAKE